MTNYSNKKNYRSWDNSIIKRYIFGCLKFIKVLFFLFTGFLNFIVSAQTIESDTPELPEYIIDTIYIDPTVPSGGDGSYGNPLNDFPSQMNSSDNTAYLIKRNTRLPESGTRSWVRFTGHGNYVGAYGPNGPKPEIHVDGGQAAIGFYGNNATLTNIHLTQHNTGYNIFKINGIDYPDYTNRSTGGLVDSVIMTGGYRGLTLTRIEDLIIRNTVVHGTQDDGIYGGDFTTETPTYWVLIDGVHVYDVNYRYINDPTDSSGGDCVQIATYNLEIKNSILDHSNHGHKFAVINSFNYSGVANSIDNTLIILHPHSNHGVYGRSWTISNSIFFGGRDQTNVWSDSHMYNNIFIGYGKDTTFTFHDGTYSTRAVANSVTDFYNNIVVNMPTAISSGGNRNIRNNIFYNVGTFVGSSTVAGSGNIHFNPDGTTQTGLERYLFPDGQTMGNTDAYEIIDPLFLNPITLYQEVNEADHDWWELLELGDYRVQSSSPAINNADADVYDPLATFMLNSTTERGFTDNIEVTHDIIGTPRPQGSGYDIGAYEYTGETGHTLIFQIENESGTAINNASITFNGTTRPPGVYTLYGIEDGTYDFSVTAPGHETYTQTGLLVEGDMEIQVIMAELPTYTISFDVKDGQDNPIGNATITFGTITNPEGNYNFSGITPGTYNYSATAPGYQTVNVNNYQVFGDATISVVMILNNYTISLNANPSAGGSVSGQGSYQHGQTVNVSAQANTGYNFVNWTENGNSVSTNADYTFTVTQNRNLVANFAEQTYTVSLASNPTGAGELSGAGNYMHNDEVTVNAQANTGYTFINWTENGNEVSTNPQFTFNITSNRSFTANFSVNNYEILAAAIPSNGGSVSGAGTYVHGQTATLTATAADDYTFTYWRENGNVVSHQQEYVFTVTRDRNLTAHFAMEVFSVALESNPAGAGILNGAGNYNPGDNVTIFAEANPGYIFENWTDGELVVSQDPQFSFTIAGDRNFTANFSNEIHTLTLNPNPTFGGLTTGAGSYPHGENVTAGALPNPGFHFVSWTQNGLTVSEDAFYSFNITRDTDLEAQFAPNEYLIQVQILPEEGGMVTGAGWYEHGQAVTLTASPAQDYVFLQWLDTGLEVSESPELTFIAGKDRDLTAVFIHVDELVKIDAQSFPQGYAFIEGAGDYPVNRRVRLNAEPVTSDYSFVGWMENGRYIGHENPFLFNATEDRYITASFTYEPGELEVNAQLSIPETGHIYGSGNYTRGQVAILQAELNENVYFIGWKNQAGQIVSRQNPYNFEVNRNMDITAMVELKNNPINDSHFQLKVYPNPSDGRFTVNLQEDAEMTVHNSQGIALETIRVVPEANQVNLGYLPSGVYFLRFQTQNDVLSAKIIIR